jgi:hypothetical protein
MRRVIFIEASCRHSLTPLIGIAQRPLSLDILGVFEGIQITIEVPFGYARRNQLLDFMEAKFPGAQISVVHSEVSNPTVSETLIRHDSANESSKTASTDAGGDSEAVLMNASDALAEFSKSTD